VVLWYQIIRNTTSKIEKGKKKKERGMTEEFLAIPSLSISVMAQQRLHRRTWIL
jgi:hypothetical protein